MFKYDSDRKLVKNVLQHLTDNIRWAARYPVPTIRSKVFEMDNGIPHVCVYGFHILDVMEPIYDYFKSLRESDEEIENFLEDFFKMKEMEIEEGVQGNDRSNKKQLEEMKVQREEEDRARLVFSVIV